MLTLIVCNCCDSAVEHCEYDDVTPIQLYAVTSCSKLNAVSFVNDCQ